MKKTIITCLLIALNLIYCQAQIPEKAEDISPLLIGEKAPNIEIKSTNGEAKYFDQILNNKKTIVLFYRGGWCPYCNVHLAAVAQSESEILELGYQILAISPDSPEKLTITGEKNQVNYQLYSDADASLIKAMGLAFKVEDKKERLDEYSGGKNPGILPVPSLFIIDENGIIQFEYISPNYKERISTELLISILTYFSDK